MNKIIKTIFIFFLFIVLVNAYSQNDLDIAATKWYILSDQFGSESECDTIRIQNDADPAYAWWNRTKCFNVWTSFYYLIWWEWYSTDLSIIFRGSGNSSLNWEKSYNDLYTELTDEDKLNDMSLNDLIKLKDDIINNPNLTDAEKELLLKLVDDAIYNKLDWILSNKGKIAKMSIDDLKKLKDWIRKNPNFTDTQKNKLLWFIDNELNRRSWLDTDSSISVLEKIWVDADSNTIYSDLKYAFDSWKLSILTSDDLDALKNWIILNSDLSWEQKAELLSFIELQTTSNNLSWWPLEKIWVNSNSSNLYNDIKRAFDANKLNLLTSWEKSELKNILLLNNKLTWEQKAELLWIIDNNIKNIWWDEEITNLIGSISLWNNNNSNNWNNNNSSNWDNNNSSNWNNNSSNWNNNSNNWNNNNSSNWNNNSNNWNNNNSNNWNNNSSNWNNNSSNWNNNSNNWNNNSNNWNNNSNNWNNNQENNIPNTYLELFNKYNLEAWSSKLFLDLIKLIDAWKVSSWDRNLLKKFINKTSLLNNNQKNHLLWLFVDCSSNQKKAIKFNWKSRSFICIDKNIRTCVVNNINYVPYSRDWWIMKFYDDRFFSSRTGLYYWKCLDDSRFQRLKPLVCLNWYKRYWNSCKKTATLDYKKSICKKQCNTVYLWQKLYYNFADNNMCECMYFKNWNTDKPSYVTSSSWSEKKRLWLRPKSSNTSSNIYINQNISNSNSWSDVWNFLNDLFNF